MIGKESGLRWRWGSALSSLEDTRETQSRKGLLAHACLTTGRFRSISVTAVPSQAPSIMGISGGTLCHILLQQILLTPDRNHASAVPALADDSH